MRRPPGNWSTSSTSSAIVTDFVFVDELPYASAGGWYAQYEHLPAGSPSWTPCNLRAVLAANRDRWLDQFDDWHAMLCASALSRCRWWWLMFGSRPNLWTQYDTLRPLFFAAAVYEWLRSHPSCAPVYVVRCPREVRIYLEEFERGSMPAAVVSSGLRLKLGVVARTMRQLLGHLARFARMYARRRPPSQTGRLLVYSHILRARELRETGDHFFGKMIDAAEASMPGDVLLSYLLHGPEERDDVQKFLESVNRRFSFLLDHLTFADLVWIFVVCLRAELSLSGLSRVVPPIRLGDRASRAFSLGYLREQVWSLPPIMELAIYRVLRRLIKQSGVRTVLYPYEEKALERGILRACSEASTPVRTLAYAHAAWTTCHLALRTRQAGCPTPPQPDRILATGPRAGDFLVGWGRKGSTDVVVVGSPNYRERGGMPRPIGDRRNGLRVLVLGGHGFELWMLANFVESRMDLFAGDEVLIRRYPFGYVGTQDRAIERLIKLSSCFRVGEGSLEHQIDWCDVALFSSTKAGLEAMLRGRLAVYVELHDLFEADPLFGSHACFARCATADQLADALACARTLPDGEYARIAELQMQFAVSILAPLDEARFTEELQGGRIPGSRNELASALRGRT